MKTRRSFLAILFSLIPASALALFKKSELASGEALKKYWDEAIPTQPYKPVSGGTPLFKNDKFYDLYVNATTGEFVDGKEIRLFLDWTPFTRDRPRYAQIRRHISTGPDDKFPSAYELKTWLDKELYPVLPGWGTCKNSLGGWLHPKDLCDEYHHSIHGLIQEPEWTPFTRSGLEVG